MSKPAIYDITNSDVAAAAAIAESKLALNYATHANTNDPTADQKAALAGTSGSPSGTNKYVTNDDGRNADARTPTSHGNAQHSAVFDALSAAAAPATSGTMTVTMTSTVVTITPSGDCQFDASGGAAGQSCSFVITTSGVTSYTLTFGTNFKATGTLATGNTDAKVFAVSFVCKDGTTWCETSRTGAM